MACLQELGKSPGAKERLTSCVMTCRRVSTASLSPIEIGSLSQVVEADDIISLHSSDSGFRTN